MTVVDVKDKRTKALFHKTLEQIYKGDVNYVYPLEDDVEYVFNADKNPSFKRGAAKRWVILNTEGVPVGRIAAFYDSNQQIETDYLVGGIGFFECIDNEKLAFLLFNTAKEWLMGNGMQAMDGPINFGERDKFWGLLVDGFTQPTYLENYNPAYYKRFFESYGFRLYFEQQTYRIDRQSFDAKRFTKVAEWISRKPGFRFEHLKMAEIDRFADDFVTVYNNAWQKFVNFKPITQSQVLRTIKAMDNILVEEFIWFSYVNNEPAGIMVMIPDVNQLLAHFKGKMTITNKLKFLYLKKFKKMSRAKGLVFGVVPKYRKYGLETVMIYKFYRVVSKTWQYNTVELSWIGKFNEKMTLLMENINAHVAKRHNTYRCLFNADLHFEPYRIKQD